MDVFINFGDPKNFMIPVVRVNYSQVLFSDEQSLNI
jgi:hypothetical protein